MNKFSKYGLISTISLPITDEFSAAVVPDRRGVLLGLVELYQHQGRWGGHESLQRFEPDDALVKLSLAELLLHARPDDKNSCRKVVRLASGLENETEVHAP